jgi:hypothetical protein
MWAAARAARGSRNQGRIIEQLKTLSGRVRQHGGDDYLIRWMFRPFR